MMWSPFADAKCNGVSPERERERGEGGEEGEEGKGGKGGVRERGGKMRGKVREKRKGERAQ
jgi:hypothetical protein